MNEPTPEAWLLWTGAEVAAYLKCGRSTLYRYKGLPGFPKPFNPGGGRPKWRAIEVKDWALRRDCAEESLSA